MFESFEVRKRCRVSAWVEFFDPGLDFRLHFNEPHDIRNDVTEFSLVSTVPCVLHAGSEAMDGRVGPRVEWFAFDSLLRAMLTVERHGSRALDPVWPPAHEIVCAHTSGLSSGLFCVTGRYSAVWGGTLTSTVALPMSDFGEALRYAALALQERELPLRRPA